MNKKKGFSKFDKPKDVFLKVEEISEKEIYAFSYNPVAQPQIGRIESLKVWLDVMDNMFRSVCKNSNYLLYIELSPTGRWHFHGYINIMDIYEFFCSDIHTLMSNGTSYMKCIDDNEEWYKYCTKQQLIMQPKLQIKLYDKLITENNDIGIITNHFISYSLAIDLSKFTKHYEENQ